MSPGGLGALGRLLLGLGVIIALVGVLLIVAEIFPGLRIGRLPGDISVEREKFRFYFPLGTSILLSILLSVLASLVLWLFSRR